LVLGDGATLLAAIEDGPLRDEIAAAGGLRLVYLDPPFATGGSFAMEVPIGGHDGGARRTVRVPTYGDAWGRGLDGYLAAMAPLLRGIHGLLADDGSLYVHCDHRANAALRLLLDEIFGPGRLVNELIWTYGLGNAGGPRAFARKHDTILFYAKTDRYRFNRPRGAVTAAMLAKYRHLAPDGTRTMRSYGKAYALKGGKPVGSVWDDIPALAPTDRERLGYPTQKPEALLERIVLASTDPGDLVADLCCGSGTTPAVAARLGRRWLACDASPLAVATTRARLIGVGRRRADAGEPVVGFDIAELPDAGASGVAGPIPGRLPSYQIRVRAAAEVVDGATTVRLIEARAVTTEGAPDPEAVGAALRPGRSALALDRGHLVRLARNRAGTLTREALTEHWSEWVEGWAAGVASEEADEPLRTAWTTARAARARNLRLTSDGLEVGGAEAPRVRVRVFDLFGGWTDTAVTLS
jgi:site-specific DNA-methyltransferase (adenine-specific)/adenine-specific DNA-methyltransferase